MRQAHTVLVVSDTHSYLSIHSNHFNAGIVAPAKRTPLASNVTPASAVATTPDMTSISTTPAPVAAVIVATLKHGIAWVAVLNIQALTRVETRLRTCPRRCGGPPGW